jgi:histidyl-tRNA synthetase
MEYDNPITPRNPRGMRDWLGPDVKIRQAVLDTMRQIFELYGFEPLQTPVLELKETISSKIGSDEKLIYQASYPGDDELVLRYDQTVPLARVIAQHPEILKPYKRYQIQNSYRADKPQKGRYREFVQVDLDIVGTSSPLADAEVLECAIRTYQSIGFKKFKMLVNSRVLLKELIVSAGFEEKDFASVTSSLDKFDKVGKAGVIGELSGKRFDQNKITRLFQVIENAKPPEDLKTLFNYLAASGVSTDHYSFYPYLARGLDYYTGAIFECVAEEYGVCALGGGGRYDNLIGRFHGDTSIPATGYAFGFEPIMDARTSLVELELPKPSAQSLVTIFSPQEETASIRAAQKLRSLGIKTDLYVGKTEVSKQLKYANQKKIPFVIIIGPSEIEENKVTLKDMHSGNQQTIDLEQAADLIRSSA